MKIQALFFLLIGFSISLTAQTNQSAQSYQTFNDSLLSGWDITTESMQSLGGETKLLLKYTNPGQQLIYPAIATYKNKKLIVESVINDQSYHNIYFPVQRPDGRILLPTTTVQQAGQFYYNLLTLEKNGKQENEINVFVNPHQTLAGGIYELGNKTLVDLQTIQKQPDNPGQQAFYNVWFNFFQFSPDGKGRINKKEYTLKSSYNEEVLSACRGNDTSFYILIKRYTKKDFSEYSGILYSVNMKGEIRWKEDFHMDQYTVPMLIPDKRGVILAVNTLWGAFLLPNTSMVTVFDINGKGKATVILEPFIANCSLRNKAGQLVLGGCSYIVDSTARIVVKKPKLMILNTADLKTIAQDQLEQYEGPDGELGMLQNPTSCEIRSMLENTDGTLLLAGDVFKPKNTTDYGPYHMYALMMTANAKGKIRR